MLKELIRRGFRKLGFDIRSVEETLVPFGVNWCDDLKSLIKENKLEVIFDVGANIGQTSQELINYFPDSYIYAFEPVPSTFKELLRNTNNFKNIKPINIAFGDQIDRLPITTDFLSVYNTFLIDKKQKKSSNEVEETTLVDVETIDNFRQRNNIDQVNLVKIDTEGYEINVLKGAEISLKEQKIDYIFAECDFYSRPNSQPHGNFTELLNYLQRFKYQVVSFYTSGVDAHGWIWGNVLFCRTINKTEGECRSFHKLSDIL
ncbi:MAG: FkbM family methyltransferase [Symploca sp. SIO1C4]|uniref:FkbM family methyltransferase n=1 Tax=Symploca sp. SIO1C4 TaxID=2607765 RepID=A0A6B3NG99_9CYAN|nr:FkbM family methyltransferase [Symploca sp. SIO1C4]NET04212.1 FkbM family methyltransferase [Symploca sp. SIO2B6]NET52387.1 FkbM family methyltransferase [Merismopedia sp. SIO2A8]